ncbi:MAG TPA: hypothetical protein PKX12_12705 [Spirochaetota bacterium]|nr:hypothetical protein [Spirochaetota bacterium]
MTDQLCKQCSILSAKEIIAALAIILFTCCKVSTNDDTPTGIAWNRVNAGKMLLESRFSESKYNISCVNRDIQGWVFFSIIRRDDVSRTDFNPHHTYAVVRNNGTVVGNSRREKLLELGKIFKSINLIFDFKKYTPKKIADIALCTIGRDMLVEEHAAKHLSAMKGKKISPPEIIKTRDGVKIIFYTVYYGMAVGNPDRYVIDVSPDYTVNAAVSSTFEPSQDR